MRRSAATIIGWQVRIIGEAKRSGVSGLEQFTRSTGVSFGHADLNGAETVHRETVRVSQRLTALGRRNARRLEKSAHLLRMNRTVCHKHATQLLIHSATPRGRRRCWAVSRGKTSLLGPHFIRRTEPQAFVRG